MDEFVCIKISAPHEPSDKQPVSEEFFTDSRLADIRRIKEIFDSVYPLSMGEWRDAFMFSENPEKELAWWVSFAKVYSEYTQGMPPDACKQAFIDLLGITVNVTSTSSTGD
jgi:hypothetical protein